MSGTERYKRGREEEEEVVGEGKRIRGLTAEGEELLHLLEDVDSGDRNLDSEDLVNGVMRSLEEEIGVGANIPAEEASVSLYDGSEIESPNRSGDSRVDLGYLLEASDDELGIPPTLENWSDDGCCADILDNLVLPSRGEYESLWQFEDQASDYGLLEYAYDVNRFNDMEGEREYVNAAAYTLFEHSDVDQSTWRREAACGI